MLKIIDLSGLETDQVANNILATDMETLTFGKVSERFLEMMLGPEGVLASFPDVRSAYIAIQRAQRYGWDHDVLDCCLAIRLRGRRFPGQSA